MPWVAPCPPDTGQSRGKQHCPKRGLSSITKPALKTIAVYRIGYVTRAHSLPSLVIQIKECTDRPSQGQGECGCTGKFGSVAPDQHEMTLVPKCIIKVISQVPYENP